ncbi:MAG TPA: Calx-beta domain-containing protein [Pyrinomonadaceae bacterium]|nr:Calx-beta domain-containing protein [Pyrinomonadaceae bacterium]
MTTDQRGRTRPFNDNATPPANGGDHSDIGAFERQSAEPTPTPTPTPLPTPLPTPTPEATPTPPTPFVFFEFLTYSSAEKCGVGEVTLGRAGDVSGTTEVTYSVGNGTATQRGDFVMSTGRVTFAPGETAKVIPVLISEDAYAEPREEVSVSLSRVTGGRIEGVHSVKLEINDNDASDGTTNPIDDPATFVCQHYHDFLNRQADPAGQAFWTNQINSCGADAGCVAARRAGVSAAFFLSPEFQQTGYFVIRAYKAAFGDTPSNPRYVASVADAQLIASGLIGGQPGFDAQLAANEERFLIDFVGRPDFRATGSLGREAYVDKLFANAGVAPTSAERDAALAAYDGKRAGRARALRSVIESRSVYNKLYNPAFVQTEYFGYLRRNANDAPDDDFSGSNFWLGKLNAFTLAGEDVTDEGVAFGRVRRAQMVEAFITSGEYRGRFHGDPSRGAP